MLWFFVGLIIIILILANCPRLRVFLRKLPCYLRILPKDIRDYFKYKKANDAPIGHIIGYIASSGCPFGSGKTLSSVRRLIGIYKRYDGNMVYHRGKFVRQHIIILSNIKINCPNCVQINTLKEYSDYIELHHNDVDRYVCYLYIDEAGSEFNSRAFVGNFTADFISDMVTCRHNWSSFIYTTQEFSMVDKLLRSVTTDTYACSHFGRVFFNQSYSPKQLESANDIGMLKPIATTGYLATDGLYSLYDTHARFKRLSKEVEEGKTLSVDEIIARKSNDYAYSYVNLSRKGRRFFRRRNKK